MWWAFCPYLSASTVVTCVLADGSLQCRDVGQLVDEDLGADEALNTLDGELAVLAKYKKRPVLVLSVAGSHYHDRAWRGGDWFLVAPIRSLTLPVTGELKTAPEFVRGVIAYAYRGLFYLPEEKSLAVREAVPHLDRAVTLHASWLLQRREARLSSPMLQCLDEWLRCYVFGRISRRFHDDLEAYRQLVIEGSVTRRTL